MKKVFFSLAVLATVALVSCGGKKAEAVDSDTVAAEVVEEVVVDSAVDTANGDTAVVAEVAEAVEAPAEAAN